MQTEKSKFGIYSDVADVGWLGQGWRVPGCQRIESRLQAVSSVDTEEKEEEEEEKENKENKDKSGHDEIPEAATYAALLYLDEQGREVPLPALTQLHDPIYIRAERIWVELIAADTVQLASQDKKVRLIFRKLSPTAPKRGAAMRAETAVGGHFSFWPKCGTVTATPPAIYLRRRLSPAESDYRR